MGNAYKSTLYKTWARTTISKDFSKRLKNIGTMSIFQTTKI